MSLRADVTEVADLPAGHGQQRDTSLDRDFPTPGTGPNRRKNDVCTLL
jgi:hypothetical protein